MINENTEGEDELLERIEQAEDELGRAVWTYARFCQRRKVPERAIPRLERFLDYERDDQGRAFLLLALGQLNETQGDYPAAAEAYTRGNALEPSDRRLRYFLRNNEGFCLNQLGAHALAEPSLREAIAIDPERHNAHKNLGVALEGLGRYAEAAESLERAVVRCPEDRRALGHLEDLAAREGAVEEGELAKRLQRCRRLVAEASPELH